MTDVVSLPALQSGPVHPTERAIAALHPLGAAMVRLDPTGMLGGWQERNATATLPHCADQLETSGALDNVRRVIHGGETQFSGMWFADSDIYKTLEAAAWETGRRADADGFRALLDRITDLLAAAQDEDGYLNSYFQGDHRNQQWRALRWSHELYCAGHLIQAAVAAARAGVGERLMTVARRFADLLVERFGPTGTDAVCGHPEIETALVELYRVTAHRPYLALARKFVTLRGRGLLDVDRMGPAYYQDHLPVLDAKDVTGHAVRQLYLLAGVVDVAVETGDLELFAAAERLWESAFQTKTYLTGAHGSRHRDEAFGDPYELPPDRAYAETCAAIASFQWNWRMLLATGGHRYADEMERVLHNGIAVATALDGRHFFYSNPLQLRSGHDGSNEDAPSQRLPWYSCACCPPNLARLMASLQSYVATTDGGGLQVHLYASMTVTSDVAEIRVDTRYPWAGSIAVTVGRTPVDAWTLSLRIPGWCTAFTLEIDGVAVPAVAENGYLRLRRIWPPGTSIVLCLDMPARKLGAHPSVDAVRGCVALARGPLVYCLEQADLPPDRALDAFLIDAEAPVHVVEADSSAARDVSIPVSLSVAGVEVEAAFLALYGNHAATTTGTSRAVELSAVPYFLWGNRTPGPMRVWIPTASTQ